MARIAINIVKDTIGNGTNDWLGAYPREPRDDFGTIRTINTKTTKSRIQGVLTEKEHKELEARVLELEEALESLKAIVLFGK